MSLGKTLGLSKVVANTSIAPGIGKDSRAKEVAAIGLVPSTGGASLLATSDGKKLLSSFKNIFGGGKSGNGSPDGFLPLDPLQEKALGLYGKQLDKYSELDPAQMARTEIAQRENQILAGANDQERQAKDLVSQRGLNQSSVGLNAILGAKRDLNDRIIQSRSMLPLLQNQYQNEQINRLNSISSGIGDILNNRIYKQGQAQQKPNYLAPFLGVGGAALGGILGGAPGAAIGYQAGTGTGTALGSR